METLVPLEFVLRTYTHNTNSSMKRAHATIFEIHECVCAVYSFSWSETRAVSTALPRSLLLFLLLLLKNEYKRREFYFNSHRARERPRQSAQPLGGSCGCWIILPVKWKANKNKQKKKVLTGSEFFFFVFYNYNGNENGRDVRHATICKTGKLKINQANTRKIRGES